MRTFFLFILISSSFLLSEPVLKKGTPAEKKVIPESKSTLPSLKPPTKEYLAKKKIELDEKKLRIQEGKARQVGKVQIKLKRDFKGAYSWELAGTDLKEILTINKILTENLGNLRVEEKKE